MPIYEADRHAKKELKKQVRGVRPIERAVEGREDPVAQATRAYCQAMRSALTDDGRPPLCAPGLRLQERLTAIQASLHGVAKKGDCQASFRVWKSSSTAGLRAQPRCGPRCGSPTGGCMRRRASSTRRRP